MYLFIGWDHSDMVVTQETGLQHQRSLLRSKSPGCNVPPSHKEEWMKNIETKSKTIQKSIPNWTFHEIPVFGDGVKECSKQIPNNS